MTDETKDTLNRLKALFEKYADIAQDERFKEGLLYADKLVDKIINENDTITLMR